MLCKDILMNAGVALLCHHIRKQYEYLCPIVHYQTISGTESNWFALLNLPLLSYKQNKQRKKGYWFRTHLPNLPFTSKSLPSYFTQTSRQVKYYFPNKGTIFQKWDLRNIILYTRKILPIYTYNRKYIALKMLYRYNQWQKKK